MILTLNNFMAFSNFVVFIGGVQKEVLQKLAKNRKWHVGNLSRHTKGIVWAQYGHVSSSSWGTVEAQLGQKA